MRRLTLSIIAVAFCSSASLAQSPLTFQAVDTDGDGRLSYEELLAVWPDLTIEEFTMVDGDRIGALTPNQLNRLQPQALPTPATMLDPAPSEPIPSDES